MKMWSKLAANYCPMFTFCILVPGKNVDVH